MSAKTYLPINFPGQHFPYISHLFCSSNIHHPDYLNLIIAVIFCAANIKIIKILIMQ
jgi:hypothetical protein